MNEVPRTQRVRAAPWPPLWACLPLIALSPVIIGVLLVLLAWEFNPIAILFEPVTWPRRFRFYQAFRSFKHGKTEEVETIRREFFAALNELAPET